MYPVRAPLGSHRNFSKPLPAARVGELQYRRTAYAGPPEEIATVLPALVPGKPIRKD